MLRKVPRVSTEKKRNLSIYSGAYLFLASQHFAVCICQILNCWYERRRWSHNRCWSRSRNNAKQGAWPKIVKTNTFLVDHGKKQPGYKVIRNQEYDDFMSLKSSTQSLTMLDHSTSLVWIHYYCKVILMQHLNYLYSVVVLNGKELIRSKLPCLEFWWEMLT